MLAISLEDHRKSGAFDLNGKTGNEDLVPIANISAVHGD
jgi:hypothetical protein